LKPTVHEEVACLLHIPCRGWIYFW